MWAKGKADMVNINIRQNTPKAKKCYEIKRDHKE